MQAPPLRKVIPEMFALQGGLDLVTPPVSLPPGKVISAINFEPDLNGGYRRMAGIERYDGRTRPSDAAYYIVDGTITGPLLIGQQITGATSGATAYVAAIESVTRFVVTKVVGTFVAESFTVSAVTYGTITDTTLYGASSKALHATYKNAAASQYRSDISTVPGSGYVRGVKYYNGNLYAFRDNAGATACVMYVASASGWTAITFGQEIQFVQRAATVTMTIAVPGVVSWTAHGLAAGHPIIFTTTGALPTGLTAGTTYYVVTVGVNSFQVSATVGGASITTSGSQSGTHTCTAGGLELEEGDTVTGNISGATGVVKRALLRTGTWSVAPAGTLVFDSVTGTFQSGEALQISSDAYVQTSTANTAITLQPGGKFEFDIVNFYGSVDSKRMYCADGVNFAGEFDGTRWVPIRTGVGGDNPKFVVGHKKQLMLAIESEVIPSGIGEPYSFTALTGAAQIALGDTITGMKAQVGTETVGVLVVLTATKVYILYGNDSTDYNLVTHSPDSGGRAYTIQNIGFAHFLDTKGVTQLQASQAFGSFQMHVLTNAVQPFIDDKAGLEISSCIVRNRNLYRIFFSDGTGLNIQMQPTTYDGSPPRLGDIMPFDYGTRVMNTVDSVVDANGVERKFGAGTDGYVYELDVGTSFDGEVINSFMVMAFHHSKNPFYRKSYRRCKLRFSAGATAHLQVSYDLSFGDRDSVYADTSTSLVSGGGAYWDSARWDTQFWDASYSQEVTIDTPGNGTSISLVISNESAVDETFTINSIQTQYFMGRLSR
jgi:hypothetical protein